MSKEIQAVLEELEAHRFLNQKYGPAVMQAAVIVELRKLCKIVEDAYNWPMEPAGKPKRGRPAKVKPSPLSELEKAPLE